MEQIVGELFSWLLVGNVEIFVNYQGLEAAILGVVIFVPYFLLGQRTSRICLCKWLVEATVFVIQ